MAAATLSLPATGWKPPLDLARIWPAVALSAAGGSGWRWEPPVSHSIQITVLHGPRMTRLACGWTLQIESKHGALVAQMLAGGPLCPVAPNAETV